MKAWVYIVRTGQRWQARCSLELELDVRYWLDADFRAGVASAVGNLPDEAGERLLWLREPIPLGQAMQLAEQWEAGRAGKGLTGRGKAEQVGEREAARRLLRYLDELRSVDRSHPEPGRVDLRDYMVTGAEGGEEQTGDNERERWGGGTDRRDEQASVASPTERGEGQTQGGDRRRRGEDGIGHGNEQTSIAIPTASRPLVRVQHLAAPDPAAARAQGRALAAAALAAAQALQGRALLRREAHALLAGAGAAPPEAASWSAMLQLAALLGRLRLGAAVAAEAQPRRRWALPRAQRQLRCQRCGSGGARLRRTPCGGCGRRCAYCEACLTMGKARECELLVRGIRAHGQPLGAAGDEAAEGRLQRWGLSPAQQAAALQALRYIERAPEADDRERTFLLWAVTGAGKTEMIFPLIDSVLRRGGRALVATPRRDVVLELDPRIRKAFPEASVATLYGGSEQRWEQGEITLATTHQLMRFEQAFDLVVVDEIDAFPFHNDEMLYYAADKARALQGVQVLLSATPPQRLRRAARRGRLPHASVPVRYHRHPLPVPQLLRMPSVDELLKRGLLPAALRRAIEGSLARGAQLFVFVQRIRQIEPLVALLRRLFPGTPIEGTSSQDPDRTARVLRFRSCEIRLLVTTTILERGVTVPRSDVFILDADGKLFDDASLIQMAGRAGRSGDDPRGRVVFGSPARNRAQASAVRQIRHMNRLARRQGYLLPSEE